MEASRLEKRAEGDSAGKQNYNNKNYNNYHGVDQGAMVHEEVDYPEESDSVGSIEVDQSFDQVH